MTSSDFHRDNVQSHDGSSSGGRQQAVVGDMAAAAAATQPSHVMPEVVN
jgi:hypothetical protein